MVVSVIKMCTISKRFRFRLFFVFLLVINKYFCAQVNCKMKTKITMLGTGNALVTKCYNTCFVISTEEGNLLTDAGGGNGVLVQLEKAGIDYRSLNAMFLTHAHTDHILGALWIVRMISTAINRGEYKGIFNIYGHSHLCGLLKMMVTEMLPKKIASEVGKGILINEIGDGEAFEAIGAHFTAFSIHSTKLEQFGYRMEYGDLKLACLGDEPYNEKCADYVKGVDWMLCEAFCLYDDRDRFHPYEKHHSTAKDAGEIASTLDVKNILLYHTEEKTLDTRKERYTAEAKLGFSGRVEVPYDLETVELE